MVEAAKRKLNKKETELFKKAEVTRGIVLQDGFTGISEYIKHEENTFGTIGVTYKHPKLGEQGIAAFAMNQMLVVPKDKLTALENVVVAGERLENVYNLADLEAISSASLQSLLNENEHIMPAKLPIVAAGVRLDEETNKPVHSSGRRYVGFNEWAKPIRDAGGIATLGDFKDHLRANNLTLQDRSGFKESNTKSMVAVYVLADESDIDFE